MPDEQMREAMRRGVKDGFSQFQMHVALRAAEEGKLSDRARNKERKVRKRMKAYQLVSSALMFGSAGLALYLFVVGNVGGGFGAAFVGLFFSLMHGLGSAIGKAIDDKHYWAAAYDWARKEVDKGE